LKMKQLEMKVGRHDEEIQAIFEVINNQQWSISETYTQRGYGELIRRFDVQVIVAELHIEGTIMATQL
jgi:hypothetical protein